MLASLDKMYDAQLEAIAEEEAGVRPRYYDKRNRIQGQSDVNALNFAEYMAGRGIRFSRWHERTVSQCCIAKASWAG